MKQLPLLIFLISFLAVSCIATKPTGGDTEDIKVKTKGLSNEISLSMENGFNLGEFSLSEDSLYIELKVTNTTSLPIRDMSLSILNNNVDFNFKHDEGISPQYPGKGGSCTDTLFSGEDCKIVFFFTPRKATDYSEPITFHYTNAFGPQTVTRTITALAGNPASLFFTNEQSTYNLGIYERTTRTIRYSTISIQNGGDLSAKSLNISLTGNTIPIAYKIFSNNCPAILKKEQSCEVTISYEPLNWDTGDPVDLTYTAQLAFDYIKDPENNSASLISYYNFVSANIEAKFTNTAPDIAFDQLVVGNRSTQNIKITNTGYRAGILKEVIIHDSSDQPWVTCYAPNISGDYLKCLKADSSLADLEFFPFKLKDLSNCLDNPTEGKTVSSSGSSCIMALSFWPSVNYLVDKDFKNTKIRYKYDSQWKDEITIKEDQYFEIQSADSITSARLEIVDVKYDSVIFPNLSTDSSYTLHDLGRIALRLNSSYSKDVSIRIKNVGSTKADLTHLKDGKSNFITTSATTIDTFFKDIIHNDCTVLEKDQDCEITFSLSPISSNQTEENNRFYDIQNSTFDRYKQFILTYKNGSVLNDDDTAFVDPTFETRLTASLIRKGLLVYESTQTSKTLTLSALSGDTATGSIILFNAGTGEIPYITITNLKNLKDPTNSFYKEPFQIIAEAPPAGIDKDCFNLITFDEGTPTATPPADPNLKLGEGETCSLTIEAKSNTASRILSFPEEIQRDFVRSKDNTPDAWEWLTGFYTDQLSFKYYDGDLTLATPDLINYGDLFEIEDFQASVNFTSPAKVVPTSVFPLSSSVIYRPSINLPTIVDPFTTLNSETVPEEFFLMQNSTPPVMLADNTIPYMTPLMNNLFEYTIFAGSFPSTGSYKVSFSFVNYGQSNADITNISLTSGAPNFTISSGDISSGTTTLSSSPSVHQVEIDFSPSTPGIKTGVLSYTYSNQSEIITKEIRIIAEAILTYPELTITMDNFDISYDPLNTPPITETLQGTPSAISSGYHYSPATPSLSFQAAKGSAVYDRKRIYVTNNSAVDINSIKVFTKQTDTELEISLDPTVTIEQDTCNNTNLLTGGNTCYIDIKYKPTLSTIPNINQVLHINYLFANGQFTTKAISLEFTAISPADLIVLGESTSQVTAPGIVTPAINENYSSYGVSFGFYQNPGHIVLQDFPKSTISSSTYTVINNSILKASFLASFTGAIPAGDPVLLLDNGTHKAYASRACLYGDDENDGGVPDEEKGFNQTTVAPCTLTFEYLADDEYLANDIDTYFNILHFKFYDFKRSSTNYLHFHFQGFIEPNRSIASDTNYINVQASSVDGSYSFEWPDFSEDNILWGPISGYRVFYADTLASFDNVYFSPPESQDVMSGNRFEFFGTTGKFMYFKVMAIRQTGSKTYLSDSQLPILKILIPPAGTIYNHEEGNIINKFIEPTGPVFLEEAIDHCASLDYLLIDSGNVVDISQKLIDQSNWDYLYSDPSFSNYNPDNIPHWIFGSTTNIATIFSSYNFDSAVQFFYDGQDNIGYSKNCTNSSCDILDLIRGGDGFDFPISSTFYVEGDTMKAIPRCSGKVLP